MNYSYVKLNLLILHYIMSGYHIILYYIILHLAFISLLIYNFSKGSNGKVELERSRLWQLDNSWRKPCKIGWWWWWLHQPKFFFIFFEVMSMSRMEKEVAWKIMFYYLFLFLMHACMYGHRKLKCCLSSSARIENKSE